ncbi:hypothetical protein B0H15DRAFT_988476 [Mycena belliarum]|uniref:Uncharacterized protein n=1 Tax=Mycena belliarum TaxID=1033014 RepID=A0AAD6XPM9_9AGAR|nr:hypothetical protein B0H15DRAFT_988476 [Mycena belliae]
MVVGPTSSEFPQQQQQQPPPPQTIIIQQPPQQQQQQPGMMPSAGFQPTYIPQPSGPPPTIVVADSRRSHSRRSRSRSRSRSSRSSSRSLRRTVSFYRKVVGRGHALVLLGEDAPGLRLLRRVRPFAQSIPFTAAFAFTEPTPNITSADCSYAWTAKLPAIPSSCPGCHRFWPAHSPSRGHDPPFPLALAFAPLL